MEEKKQVHTTNSMFTQTKHHCGRVNHGSSRQFKTYSKSKFLVLAVETTRPHGPNRLNQWFPNCTLQCLRAPQDVINYPSDQLYWVPKSWIL